MTTHGDSIAELDFLTEYQRDLHVPGDEGEIMTSYVILCYIKSFQL
jgi:hypothetical protein